MERRSNVFNSLSVTNIEWRESFKAVIILERFPNGVRLVLQARHFLRDSEPFLKALPSVKIFGQKQVKVEFCSEFFVIV